MKKNILTLIRAMGSVLVLSPSLVHPAPPIQSNADAFRRDARAIRSDFNKAASSANMTTAKGRDEK